MLHEFLKIHQAELIDRCRGKVALRQAPTVTQIELEHGIPLFLAQLIKTLQVEQSSHPMQSRKVSGPAGGGVALSEISATAAQHGRELLRQGFTVDQVIHDYGDLCQAITDLAHERGAHFEVDEFRTLNRCLDNGIADAVTEFSYLRDSQIADREAHALTERLGALAHELRNHIHTAILAVTAVKTGSVGLAGATGAILDRSLIGMRNLIDRSLADVRVRAGIPPRYQLLSLADFIAEVQMSASLEAKARGAVLVASVVDRSLAVDADRDMLFSAVGNLLQNAFKFTGHHSVVTLNAYASADHIRIDIEDCCGGLAEGEADQMFRAFSQTGKDRSGLGLGLSIAHRCVEVNRGALSVRNVPGTGCVFTIQLPRHTLPVPAVSLN
jgi:signal transduction histidine kinase